MKSIRKESEIYQRRLDIESIYIKHLNTRIGRLKELINIQKNEIKGLENELTSKEQEIKSLRGIISSKEDSITAMEEGRDVSIQHVAKREDQNAELKIKVEMLQNNFKTVYEDSKDRENEISRKLEKKIKEEIKYRDELGKELNRKRDITERIRILFTGRV